MHASASLPIGGVLQIPASVSALRSSTRAGEQRTSVRANVCTNLFQIGVTGIIISRERKTVGNSNGRETVSSCIRRKHIGQNSEGQSGGFFCFFNYSVIVENVMWRRDGKTHTRKSARPAKAVQTARWSPGGGGKTNLIFTGSEWPLAT